MGALTLRHLATALGGDIVGRQVNCPGPNHSRIDRSLGVRPSSTSPVGFVMHSYSGDDFAACRDFVLMKLGMPIDAWRTKGQGAPHSAPTFTLREPEDDRAARAARIDRAATIWAESEDAHGTLAQRYLESRDLVLPDGADAIRYHARTPWRDDETSRTIRVPAMVCLMRSITTDEQLGIHRTRLTPEGVKVDRRMLGQASGAAIKLDADDAVTMGLAIGEGVETCLAARQLGFRPVWALGSAGAISAFPVLGGIEALTVFAENDATNARAVETCAARWHEAGREVTIIEPASGSDLNDAMRGAR